MESPPSPDLTSSPDRAREVVTTFYEAVWNRRDTACMGRIAHADFTFRGSLGTEVRGTDAFIRYVELVTTALAEYRCDVETLVVEDDRAFVKVLFSGVHRGELLGYRPTGHHVSWYGAALFSFRDGRIADLWILGDVDGLKRQLAEAAPVVSSGSIRAADCPPLLGTMPATLLHAEGAALLVAAVLGYARFAAPAVSWWPFAIGCLAPDLAMAGYAAGRRLGAATYNLAHTEVFPLVLLAVAGALGSVGCMAAAWGAHHGH